MCDVSRQLSKLHVTPNLPDTVKPIDKLIEKMGGFYLSDANTPIIGDLACLVVGIHGVESNTSNGLRHYFSTYPEHVQFPNEDEQGWMTLRVVQALPTFDFILFRDWLDAVRAGTASILEPPLCTPAPSEREKVKRPVVVNGEISLPDPPREEPKIPLEEAVEKGRIMPKCAHLDTCTFGVRCNHVIKVAANTQKCYGKKCKFAHGKAPVSTGASTTSSVSDGEVQA